MPRTGNISNCLATWLLLQMNKHISQAFLSQASICSLFFFFLLVVLFIYLWVSVLYWVWQADASLSVWWSGCFQTLFPVSPVHARAPRRSHISSQDSPPRHFVWTPQHSADAQFTQIKMALWAGSRLIVKRCCTPLFLHLYWDASVCQSC